MIDVIDHGPVRELRLARPPVNALNVPLIDGLREALATTTAAGCRAAVISGAPGRFSGGLDVPELLTLSAPEIRALWTSFFGLMRDIAAAPVPVVAAMTGHSPAGGMVLALFADYRILASGPYRIGLNEVQVGLPVPPLLIEALALVVGARQAARLTVGGLLVESEEALRIGLVDELAPLEEVIPRAVSWAADLLTRPPRAMATTRELVRRPLIRVFDSFSEATVDTMTRAWSSEETQVTMKAMSARLGKPARAASG